MLSAVWLLLGSLTYSLQLAPGSFPKALTAQEEAHYLALAGQGDLEARNVLIERNLRLVAHITKKYFSQTGDQEDLISIGTIGLIKAVESYDLGKKTKFSTYASRCIENEILMYFRGRKKTAGDISLEEPLDTDRDGNSLTLMELVSDEEDIISRLDIAIKAEKLREVMGSGAALLIDAIDDEPYVDHRPVKMHHGAGP